MKYNPVRRIRGNNILGAGLDLLYPLGMEDRPDLSPVFCVGQGIYVDCGTTSVCLAGIFLSQDGRLAFVLSEPAEESAVSSLISVVRSWSCEDLDELAGSFTYDATGQAFRIIDLFARHFGMSFSAAHKLSGEIDANLRGGRFFIFSMIERGD